VRVLTVKICGLSDTAGLDAALAAGADMVGFVFFEPSPRHVALDRARALGAHVAGRARKVALTVDADDAGLAAVVEALAPDILQLHGEETPERVTYVRARFGLPVMRAIGLATPADLAEVARFDAVADHLLFDARAPKDASLPGGNGAVFDWSLLRVVAARKPWLLAGGLHCDNVEAALGETGAKGLDVSSGVESGPGVKDPHKIARFVAQARRAAEALGSARPIG
jgi:phosphoribosylanthranilate isomerase